MTATTSKLEKEGALIEARLKVKELKALKAEKFKKKEFILPDVSDDLDVCITANMIKPLMKMQTANKLRVEALSKTWEMNTKQLESLHQIGSIVNDSLEHQKKIASWVFEKHPVIERVMQIKGISSLYIGLVMAEIKDPSKFINFGNLVSYAGVGEKYGLFLAKRNLNEIQKVHHNQFLESGGLESDYNRTGYNTHLQSLLWNMCETLLQYQTSSFLFKWSRSFKERLPLVARNKGITFVADETAKKENPKYEIGREYIKGRDCYSLDLWVRNNIRWRVARVILNIIWTEWMKEKGLPIRDLYVVEYLSHNQNNIVTLETILNFEKHHENTKI